MQSQEPVVDSSEMWQNELRTDSGEAENPDPLIPQLDEEFEPQQKHKVKPENLSPVHFKKKIKKKKLKLRKSSIDSNSDGGREDEFDIYGKFIAAQLRGMELQQALRIQLEIQNLISEARISNSV